MKKNSEIFNGTQDIWKNVFIYYLYLTYNPVEY